MTPTSDIRIVIPCYNEGAALSENTRRIAACASDIPGVDVSFLFVNDGSSDGTLKALRELSPALPNRTRYISFTRNFGKEAALTAGLQYSMDADAVIVMDADLGHPPALIPELIERWREGYLIVEAVRDGADTRNAVRSWLARGYYRSLQILAGMNLGKDTDYKLLDRRVVVDYLALPERQRFFKGLIKWGGYSSWRVPFERPGAQPSKSGWRLRDLFAYGLNSMTSFTTLPLQLVTYLALAVFFVSAISGVATLIRWLLGDSVEGFTTVIVLLALFASAIMLSVGILGFYVGKIYEEIKARPPYVMDYRNCHLEGGEVSDGESQAPSTLTSGGSLALPKEDIPEL